MEGGATVAAMVVTMPGMAALPRRLRTYLTPGLLTGMARPVDTFSSMSKLAREHGSIRDTVVVAMDSSLHMAVEDTVEEDTENLRDMVVMVVVEEGMEKVTPLKRKNSTRITACCTVLEELRWDWPVVL